MGRKIEMKKIQDKVRCQVTFSKRRTDLITRAHKISVMCETDVAFVAFSPSGRISKFSSRDTIEELIETYTNLPPEKRLSHLKNVQEKMAKLEELNSLGDDDAKTHYLDNRIENLKAQLEKRQREVQIAEANLGDYELNPNHQSSLQQISWCENNLLKCMDRMQRIKLEKLMMENESTMTSMHNSNITYQFQPQSSEFWKDKESIYPENLFNQMLGEGKGKEVAITNGVPLPISSSYGLSDAPLQVWMEAPVPQQQSENLNSSFGNFSGLKGNNYYLGYPTSLSSSNLVDTTTFDLGLPKNQPIQVLNETNGMEKVKEINNGENGDALPLVQYSPSTPGFPCPLYDMLLSQDPLADLATIQNAEGVVKAWNENN